MKKNEQKEEIFLIIVVVVTVILVFTMKGKTKANDIGKKPEDDDDNATDSNTTEDDDNDANDTNISEEDDNDATDSNTTEKNDKDDTNANTTDKWNYNWLLLLLLVIISCIFILIILYRKIKTSLQQNEIKTLTRKNNQSNDENNQIQLTALNSNNDDDHQSYDSFRSIQNASRRQSSSVKAKTSDNDVKQIQSNNNNDIQFEKRMQNLRKFNDLKKEPSEIMKKTLQYKKKYGQNLDKIPIPQNEDKIIHQLAIAYYFPPTVE